MKQIPLSPRPASRKRCPFALILAAAAALTGGHAKAQSLTWDANTTTTGAQDGSGTWNLMSANWWDGMEDDLWSNSTPDSAIFGVSTAGGTVTLGANITVADITFNTTAPAYTIAGGGFTLTLSDTVINGTGNGIISANLAGTGGFTVTNTGVVTGTNTLVLSGNNSALSGSIIVSGASSSTGAVTLDINSANALGSVSSVTVDNGSTLVLNTSGATFGAGQTLLLYGVGMNSGGALQGGTSMTTTWVGNIVLESSGTRLGGGSGGTLIVDGVVSQATVGSSALFSRNPGSITILNAVNTYTGDTQLYGGEAGETATLKIGVNNAISAASDLSILSTAAVGSEVLDLNGYVLTLRGLDTSANQLSGSQDLSILNNGASPSVLTIGDPTVANTKIFSGSIDDGTGGLSLVKIDGNTQILIGNNGYTGATTIDAGTLQLGSSLATGTTGLAGSTGVMASLSFILNGGSFVINNTGLSNNSNTRISDSAIFTLNGGAFLYQGSDQSSTNSSETIGGITFGTTASSTSATGYSTFTVQFNSTNTAAVTAGQLTRAAGGATALVNGANLGEGSGATSSVASLLLTTAPTLVGTTPALSTGINTAATNTEIVPYLLGEVSATTGLGTATGTPDTFVTYNSTTGLRPLSLSEFATSISSGDNVYLTSAGTSSSTMAINSLILGAGASLTISSGVLTDTSGALLFANAASITGGTFDFGSAEGIITVNTGFTGQIASKITGTDGVTVFGSGTLGLGGQSVFTGDLMLRGAITVPQTSSIQTSGVVTSGPFGLGTVVFAGGQMRASTTAGASAAIGNSVIIQADTTFDSSPNSLTFSGAAAITNGTRTITNDSAGPIIFSGAIGDGGQNLGLTFAGTGTTTLSGANTYTGGTTITSGEVIVSGSISGSAVTVGNSASLSTSAILGGSGTVGNVTMLGSGSASTSGATIDPGNSPNVAGILKTGSLSATNGANLAFEIGGDTPGGESTTGYDQLIASGAVTLTGGNLALTLLGSPTFQTTDELFLIINNSGAPANGDFGSITLNGVAVNPSDIMLGNQQFQLVYNADYTGSGSDGIANDVALIAVIPEPAAPVMLLGGFGLLCLFRRRRR